MSWEKREPVTNLVILGDAEGNVKKIGGLLIGIEQDRGYPDKSNYQIVKQDGETVTLSGSASLARQIGAADVGKFIKCEFAGWGKSANGKFKAIDVNVWNGEPTDAMKTWPQYAETIAKLGATKGPKSSAPTAKAAVPAGGGDNFEDFPGALNDEDDDLPF
jgi:hypothetical protein